MKLKQLIIVVIVGLLPFTSYCQSETLSKKEQRKIAREEKKRLAEEQAAKEFELLKAMVMSGKYVVQAERLIGRDGREYSVQSNLNFVKVDGEQGVIQSGTTNSSGGNGLGGRTASGKIKNYTVKVIEKRRSFNIKYDLHDIDGSFSVTLSVGQSGYTVADVRDNILNANVRMSGNLVSLEESTIFKGAD